MARCPECGGFLKWVPAIRQLACQSCGLSLTRNELDNYWKKIRNENYNETDALTKSKNRRKEWLDWYSKSKEEKERY